MNVYVTNAFMALPGILLAIAFVAFMGPGLGNVILALAISGWVGYARLVRAQVYGGEGAGVCGGGSSVGGFGFARDGATYSAEYSAAADVQAAIGMAGAVLAEATLSFLGLGVPPPTASWGSMLNDARSHLFDSPHMVVFPAVAVMLCVLAFNFIGDALRDWMDPRTRMSAGCDPSGDGRRGRAAARCPHLRIEIGVPRFVADYQICLALDVRGRLNA